MTQTPGVPGKRKRGVDDEYDPTKPYGGDGVAEGLVKKPKQAPTGDGAKPSATTGARSAFTLPPIPKYKSLLDLELSIYETGRHLEKAEREPKYQPGGKNASDLKKYRDYRELLETMHRVQSAQYERSEDDRPLQGKLFTVEEFKVTIGVAMGMRYERMEAVIKEQMARLEELEDTSAHRTDTEGMRQGLEMALSEIQDDRGKILPHEQLRQALAKQRAVGAG